MLNILCECTREIFSGGSDALFPRRSHLCRACVRAVEKLINLRQNIQKEENALRELVRRAGEAKGLSIGSTVNEPGKH